MIIRKLIFIVALLVSRGGFSQMLSDTVDVSFSKTTSVIFKYPIVNVDRGSPDVIAQKVKEVENILQLKAGIRNFPETNVSVITADGILHHFYINYSDQPRTQVYHVDKGFSRVSLESKRSEVEYEIATDQILNHRKGGAIGKDRGFRINLILKAIYVHDDMLFLQVHIRNKSNIKYDLQSLRFFVRDKRKVKRTSVQEIELRPVYVRNATNEIHGHGFADIVYVLDKFTIPDAKTLDIELFEKNGGRNLKLRIGNHSIVKAERIPIK